MKTPFALLAKHYNSETNSSENQLVSNWRFASKENELEFERLKDIWKLTQQIDLDIEAQHSEKVWNKINHNISAKHKIVQTYSRSVYIKTISIAASVALILGFGLSYLLSSSNTNSYTTVITPRGQKAQIELPDGTQVWLNSDTKITYPTNFNANNRSVTLSGEAFFDVKKQNHKLFKVLLNKISVNVFGTAFNVNAYPENKSIQVALLRGKVTVNHLHDGKLLTSLLPNQKAEVFNNQKTTYKLSNCNAENDGLWRFGKLKIENISMEQVAYKMEHWYGVNIQVENLKKFDNKRYWMTIKTESLTEMLQVINKITPISYTIKGEEVNIMYK